MIGDPRLAIEQVQLADQRWSEALEASVEAPPDLNKHLQRNVHAKAHWEKFSPAQRRAWVEHVAEAKKADVRARRIEEAVQRIALGKQP